MSKIRGSNALGVSVGFIGLEVLCHHSAVNEELKAFGIRVRHTLR